MFECRECSEKLSNEHEIDYETGLVLDNEIQKHSKKTGHTSFRKVKHDNKQNQS